MTAPQKVNEQVEYPRPWEKIEFDGEVFVSAANAEIVAHVYAPEAADAIVAYAAPDLLEAATALLACAGTATHWTDEEREGADYLRAAVARATGVQP